MTSRLIHIPFVVATLVFALPNVSFAGSQNYTSPGTYYFTVPTGVTSVRAQMLGAGGGGAGSDGWGDNRPGGGGGGGGYSDQTVTVSGGQVLTVTVGRGGQHGRLRFNNIEYCGYDSNGTNYGTKGGMTSVSGSFGQLFGDGGGGAGGGVGDSSCGYSGSGGFALTPGIAGGTITCTRNVYPVTSGGGFGWWTTAGWGGNGSGSNGYSFTCPATGQNGQVILTWTDPPTVTLQPFSPSSITTGQGSYISFSSTNATSCTGYSNGLWSGNLGATSANNAYTGAINTAGSYYQYITCSGPGGSGTSATQYLTVTPAAKPDLIVGSMSPTTGKIGETRSFSATVSNIGNASTGSSFWSYLQQAYDANGSGAWDTVGSMYTAMVPAGGTTQITTNAITLTAAGTWYFRACTDKTSSSDSGIISESNESNNCGPWTTVTVSESPPATPTGLTATPGSCGTRQINLSWDSVSGATSYALYRDGTLIYNGPGTYFTSSSLTEGAYYTFYVTASNSGGTSAASSNVGAYAPSACSLSGPDLIAGAFSPTSATAGAQALLSSTITNQGNAGTGGSFFAFFQTATNSSGAGATQIGDYPGISSLEASASDVAYTYYTFPNPGTVYARLCADKRNASDTGLIAESNENNNCGSWSAITVNAANRACSATTISNCSLSSTASGGTSGSCSAGYTGSCVYSCSDGTWSVSSNSCAVPAAPQPDLIAGAISPTSATVGAATTFSATITNEGGETTGAPFNNFLQVATAASGGGTITDLTSTSMAALGASGSAVTSKGYTFPSAGTYSMRACADKSSRSDTGTIAESDENDNCGSPWTTITVSAAPAEPTGACLPVMRTSGTSWTIPSGVTSVKVWAIGAGGGGAGAVGSATAGGAGGAGAVTYKTYAVTAGQPLTYSLGVGGYGGYGAMNGNSGAKTTATYGETTITAAGGAGGWYNYGGTLGVGGSGYGGDGAVTGGTGSGAAGNTGGGGGGAIGGTAGEDNGRSGGTGGQSVDVSGLFAVLSTLGISTTAPGVGGSDSTSNPGALSGTSATGFGSGGGGAGWFGGDGGEGRYGGGGGGAAGYSYFQQGGIGGAGVVVINPVACNSIPETPTASLSASPESINTGQSTTLTWSSSGATSCTFADTGAVGTSGNRVVSPSVTSTYSITCTGPGGTSAPANATVTVVLPTLSISADPNRVKSGGSTSVSWDATNVRRCTVTRNGAAWKSSNANGAKVVKSSSNDTVVNQTTYILSCTDVNDNPIAAKATVIVNLSPGFQEF